MDHLQALAAPALLPDTVVFDLGAEGEPEPWRLFVHVPPGPAPTEGWPLLVIVDGNAMIATAVDTVRVQSAYPGSTGVAPGVVAAIGYPTQNAYDPLRRSFDLSPPPGRSYPPFTPDGPTVRTGGADRFLRFIENRALGAIERLAPVHATRRTLFGHSFGGLFALYALFGGAGSFDRFVAASPTISWEDAILLERERQFLETIRLPRPVTVHLSAGEYEGERLAPFQYGREDTPTRLANARTVRTLELTEAMAGRLAEYEGLRVRFETYPGETHMSVLPIAVSRAVRTAFEIEAPLT